MREDDRDRKSEVLLVGRRNIFLDFRIVCARMLPKSRKREL